MRLPASPHCRVQVGQHLRRLHVPVGLVNDDFHAGVFQIHQPLQSGIQGKSAKHRVLAATNTPRLLWQQHFAKIRSSAWAPGTHSRGRGRRRLRPGTSYEQGLTNIQSRVAYRGDRPLWQHHRRRMPLLHGTIAAGRPPQAAMEELAQTTPQKKKKFLDSARTQPFLFPHVQTGQILLVPRETTGRRTMSVRSMWFRRRI